MELDQQAQERALRLSYLQSFAAKSSSTNGAKNGVPATNGVATNGAAINGASAYSALPLAYQMELKKDALERKVDAQKTALEYQRDQQELVLEMQYLQSLRKTAGTATTGAAINGVAQAQNALVMEHQMELQKNAQEMRFDAKET